MATDLFEFLATGATPWTGHDPAPWVTVEGDEITVWSDGGHYDRHIEPCIRTNRHEFEAQLASACATLATFGHCCGQWLIDHEVPRADEIHRRIARDFASISAKKERTDQGEADQSPDRGESEAS